MDILNAEESLTVICYTSDEDKEVGYPASLTERGVYYSFGLEVVKKVGKHSESQLEKSGGNVLIDIFNAEECKAWCVVYLH